MQDVLSPDAGALQQFMQDHHSAELLHLSGPAHSCQHSMVVSEAAASQLVPVAAAEGNASDCRNQGSNADAAVHCSTASHDAGAVVADGNQQSAAQSVDVDQLRVELAAARAELARVQARCSALEEAQSQLIVDRFVPVATECATTGKLGPLFEDTSGHVSTALGAVAASHLPPADVAAMGETADGSEPRAPSTCSQEWHAAASGGSGSQAQPAPGDHSKRERCELRATDVQHTANTEVLSMIDRCHVFHAPSQNLCRAMVLPMYTQSSKKV